MFIARTYRRSERASRESKARYRVTRRIKHQPVIRFGITFVEPRVIEEWSTDCRICGKTFDPFTPGPFAEQHRDSFCSEECWVEQLAAKKVRSNPPPWARNRCPTADRNLRQRGVKRQTLRSISAARQERLETIREMWESGLSAVEISKRLRLRHTAIYQDLKFLGIDPKQSQSTIQATAAREQLLDTIAALIESGQRHSDIAPQVNLSTEMVSYHARALVRSGRLAHSTKIGHHRSSK